MVSFFISKIGVISMAEKKVDETLIEKLRNGQIFEDKPKETDPTKLNEKDLTKGGGGSDGSEK